LDSDLGYIGIEAERKAFEFHNLRIQGLAASEAGGEPKVGDILRHFPACATSELASAHCRL
jgi:hypothetical protein